MAGKRKKKKNGKLLLNMKQEKIKSISHKEKVWWIKVRPTNNSIKYLHEILKKYDGYGYGLDWNCNCDVYPKEKFTTNYKEWKNREFSFFSHEECGYIFFMDDRIEIILRKEAKLFSKLKKEFLKNFEFIKSKY